VWESEIDGKKLKLHLAAINNQNFIIQDEETGTWWQQVSGEAVQGPLKGKRLTQVFHDELSFAIWKHEHPSGRVLRPDERVKQKYEPANWEEDAAKQPVVTPVSPNDKLQPRALVAGIEINGKAVAFPQSTIEKQRLILHSVGATPLFILLGEDNKSVRAFEREVDGRTLEFFVKADATPLQIVDAETGTTWNFRGKAINGQLVGKQLKRIAVLKDYWFDWKLYHPDTSVYTLGESLKQ
jgi:hypothetical protein